MKKLLYLSDLYNFYVSQNKNVKFSSKDTDHTIVVHIDEPFIYNETEDNDLIMRCPLRLCHTLTNKNKSHIPEKAMKEAIPSAYNMPILGYIYKNEDDDEYCFAGHEFFVNNDGDVEYEESPCGTVPESAGLKLVKYDGDNKSYLEGKGIIWRTYTRAADIIEREKELSVSVELVVDELSFDSKNKELVIDKFRFSGVTILGKDRETGEEIKPGMENSIISISDFSETNNSIFSQNEKVIKLLSELNKKLDGLNIDQNLRKEETMKKKFEEKFEEVKDTPSGVKFDETDGDGGNDGNDGIDYYEPEETEQQEPETPGENNDIPLSGNDDNPPDNEQEEVVGEPSAEDIAAAEAATTTINALTNSSTAADVAEARAEYDALSDEAKALIEPEVYAKLEAQETRIANQEAADTVTAMITALTDSSSTVDVAAARAAYEALTTDQKALISAETLSALEAQEDRIDEEAADAVTDMIEALTDESTAEEVEAARQAYDALTEAQKAYVSAETLAYLEEQEERISNEGSSNDDIPKKKRINNSSNIRYSVKCNGKIKTHYATLSEKLMALSDLVNATYGETDCTWYSVDADEDKKVVYMHDYWCDKHYRQSYSVKKNVYTLIGDRVETFVRYMSQDEINEFEKMKSDFSLATEKLSQYESEDDKIALLQSEDYKQIRGTKVYEELAKKETYFSMPITDLEKKLDDALLKYAKGNELKFSNDNTEKKSVGMKLFGNPTKKITKTSNRYGGLFSE